MMRALKSSAFLSLLYAHVAVCRQPIQKEAPEQVTEDMEMAASVMDGFDTDKNGKLSMAELLEHVSDASGELPAEFAGWKDGFKEADLNQDGHLTVTELHSLLQSVQEPEKEKVVEESEVSVAEQIMDGMDANKDGHLSLKELMDHVGDESKLHAAFKGWKEGFTEADKDKDGLLSVRELGHLLHGVSRQDQHHLVDESELEVAKQVMDGFDKDKNGQISLKELMDHVGDSKELHAAFEGWKEGFVQADKNENGQLDLPELSTLLQHVSRGDQHKLVEESEMDVAASVMAGFDTDKNGEISLKELMEHVGDKVDGAFAGWQEGFKQADADGNGALNMRELSTLLQHVSREQQHGMVHQSEREVAAQVMDGFDTNKDGKISLMELLDHIGDNKDVHASFAGWQEGFKEADVDQDQHLDLDELTILLEHISREDQEHMVDESELETAAQIMEGFDINKNGKISLQELNAKIGDDEKLHAAFAGWKEGFEQADLDGDGELTVEELAQLLQHVSRDDQHEMVHQSEEEIAASIMDGFDTDKNQLISLQELMDRVGDNDQLHAAFEGWQEGFLQADIDEDGQLNVHELATLLKHVSREGQHEMVEESGEQISQVVMDGFDTNHDGKISLRELLDHVKDKDVEGAFEGWKDGFKEADADSDGHLDRQELTDLLNHVSRGQQQELVDESEESIAEAVMRGWDTNKDGKLTLAELHAHVGDNEKVHAAFQGWQEGFETADVDKDGALTIEELASLLSRVSNKDQHQVVQDVDATTQSLLQGFDADHDGKVSLEEIMKHVGKLPAKSVGNMLSSVKEGFAQADKDKDGGLDATELAHLLHALNERPKHDEM
jgi:Ca2+-binding EF-hand superfamily protein